MENKLNRMSAVYQLLKVSFIAIAIVLVSSTTATSKNYYFSTSTGNDAWTSTQAQSLATPWKTIDKLNSFFASLAPGDAVLFKRGETFYGTINVQKSGTSSLPIIIGAYGSGSDPVISGFSTISSWTAKGNGIYESAVTTCKPTLNMVTLNGVQKAIGRYPNTGYLTFESHVGTSSITDNQLSGTPNWTGAEVVIRKNPYTIGRNPITNHTSGTLTYSKSGAEPKNNFGYFIQNDPKTLDLLGEWYLNPITKRIQMYFGVANPSSYTVKVSTLDTLVYCNGKSFITITNLSFTGANYAGAFIASGQNISFLFCKFDLSGTFGIYGYSNSPNLIIEHCIITNSNHKAIQTLCTNASIRYNIIKNVGIIPGMANEVGGYNGIEIQGGDGTIIEFNEIDSVGKHGIFLRGNNTLIKNNLINYFALTLDDCGGIYTAGINTIGRKIIGNIILNGIGEPLGTNTTNQVAKGIFLDEPSANIEITGNTVANCSLSGLHCNNTHDIIVQNNLFYNNNYSVNMNHSNSYPNDPTRNVSILNNIFFAKTPTQVTLRMWSVSNDIAQFGTADNNYYCRPIDDNYLITKTDATTTSLNLAGWQTFTGKDKSSKKSPQSITNVNDLRFEYNATNSNKTISLPSPYIDAVGKLYTSSITLLPYTSTILIKSSTTIPNQLPKILNQNFQLNENSVNGTIAGTVIGTDPDAGQLLTYSIISGNTSGAFAINTSTGVLTVTNSAALNFEVNPTFALVVKVQDNGSGNLSSQATITMSLKDINEAPVINNQSFSVYENSATGLTVGSIVATDPDAGQTKTFSILSGNTNNAFSINTTTGMLKVATSASLNYQATPSFSLVVKVQDNGTPSLSGLATITVNLTTSIVCSASGTISYEVWYNIGNSVSVSSLTSNVNYPDNPSSSTLINSMEGTTNLADGYGARIAGYICAPSTGSYTFWIASDDNGELWLSSNDLPANKQKIAYHNGYTGAREWNKYTTQRSGTINLVQGQKYYIETLMKDATGGDNLAVGWLKPGQTGNVPSEVIPGSVLSPLVSSVSVPVSSISLPPSSSVNVGSNVLILSTVLPSIASNNFLNWTSSNPAIAKVDNNGFVTGISAGTVTITATSTDGSNKSDNCLITVTSQTCSATGNITYQVWNNIGNSTSVSSLTSNINYPDNPSSTTLITSMEGTTNLADGFGAKIAGYICAPTTGSYTFWIASDDYGELWLSTDSEPANKQKIAYHNGYTWIREWNKYPTQKSVTINLIQGQTYYIEALMKDAGGGDNLAVGWLKPGQTGTVPSEVIPGTVLSPISSARAPIACSAVGNISYEIWNNIGNGVAVTDLTTNINYPNNPTSSVLITSMEGASNQADNYGARISGYICAPTTGSYTFWIASDDYGELWLSTDDLPANEQKIAYVIGYTASRQWDKYASQKSVQINLVQGQRYYIKALKKDAAGGDNLAVGWLRPGQTGIVPSEIVPGSVLSPLGVVKSKQVTTIANTTTSTESKISLLVYPNPLNSDVLNVKLENILSEATIKIYSIAGVLCYDELVSDTETIHIDRSVFKSGIYIVKAYNNDFVKTIKLIVK
ncbi:MAG: PA14 domain-containing protein [Candidatus Saccharimonadaceae bacterium]